MSWFTPIDAYCERVGPAFWAEPWNAVSNAAFLIVAVLAFQNWRRASVTDGAGLGLILLVGLIGVGSFLFHTFANGWSVLADTLPIAVFIFAYFALALRRFFGLGWVATICGTLLFGVASLWIAHASRPLLGSSGSYAPALLALYGIGLTLLVQGKRAGRLVTLAGLIFTLSLGFRMADEPLCAAWPFGTHMVWHVLNALTLGALLWAAQVAAPFARSEAPKK